MGAALLRLCRLCSSYRITHRQSAQKGRMAWQRSRMQAFGHQQAYPAIIQRYGENPLLNDWTQVLLQGERHHGVTERKQWMNYGREWNHYAGRPSDAVVFTTDGRHIEETGALLLGGSPDAGTDGTPVCPMWKTNCVPLTYTTNRAQ